jgi:hypothetical protein
MNRNRKEIVNCLISDLSDMISEHKSGILTEESIYSYFSEFLIYANVDSSIVVDVLEQPNFGELGKQQALSIKVNEGW